MNVENFNQNGILISLIYYPILTLGPEKRVGIWVQGCNHKCFGCISKHTWDFDETKRMSWGELENTLRKYLEKTKRLTISGGEPFQQLDELVYLLKFARTVGYNDILLYTGYTVEELVKLFGEKFEVVTSLITALVDGRFVYGLESDLIWKGSENQRMFIYTKDEELKNLYENFRNTPKNKKVQVIYKNDELFIVGIPYQTFSLLS